MVLNNRPVDQQLSGHGWTLKKLRHWVNRAKIVQACAAQLGLTLLPLPGYSPDLNPIEGLWQWMRQEVTQHFCHDTLPALFDDCLAFINRINLDPEQIIARLWPKFELDPDYEKLLVSN